MDKPFQTGRCVRWGAGFLLSLALAAGAEKHDVQFSFVMPEADRVHLAGSFNGWEISDDTLMANENGVWRKTLSLDDGTYAYNFKAAGEGVPSDGWLLDWKSTRETRKLQGRISSTLVVPDDLDVFRGRQRGWSETENGIEIPLHYDRYPDKGASQRPSGASFQQVRTVPPSGDWKLPDFVGAQPLFSVARLGGSKYLAVIDRKSADDPFYNRVFFDRNGNHDLTDDPPLEGAPRPYGDDGYFDCAFPPVDLEIDVGGQKMPYCLALRISGNMPKPAAAEDEDFGSMLNLHLLVSSHCAYVGEFALDGTGYRIALADTTGNGRFDDRAVIPEDSRYADQRLFAEGDSLFFTTADTLARASGLPLGNFLAIGARLFEVRLDVPGGRLTLAPRTENVGTLEVAAPMQTMSMMSAAGDEGLMLVRIGERTTVPAGTWRLLDYRLVKKDEWGDEWALQAKGSEDSPPVPVPADGSGRLAAGEPLQASVEIPDPFLQRAAASGSLRMSLGLLGNAHERITDLSHVSGTNTQHKLAKRSSNRPEEAAYRIIRPDGERIASGSFEYG